MSKPKTKLNSKGLKQQLANLKKYMWIFLLLFFVAVYGYVLLSINNFTSAQPTQDQVSADLKTSSVPVINPQVVQKLESMQNNSVSVQALFNQGRQNPFVN